MKFSDNANLTTFLLNAPVELRITTDDNRLVTLKLTIPTVTDLFTNTDLQIVLGMLNTPLDKLQQNFPTITNLSYYNLLIMLRLNDDKIVFKQYLDCFINAAKVFGLSLVVDGNHVIFNDIQFNEEAFEYLRQLMLVMTKVKSKTDNVLEKDERYKASQDLIARIKNQNKSNNAGDSDKNFEKNYITLLYEFGLKPEEISKLNIYQYERILSYTNGAINYKISTIAMGNGLSKKLSYITQGGKK